MEPPFLLNEPQHQAALARIKAMKPVVCSFDPAAMYALLKDYVNEIRNYGLAALAGQIAGSRLGYMPEALQRLDEVTATAAPVATAEQLAANAAAQQDSEICKLLASALEWNSAEQVCRLTDLSEHMEEALSSYCLIVDMVEKSGDVFCLHFGNKYLQGGWVGKEDYDAVNLLPGKTFDRKEQNSCVFPLGRKGGDVQHFCVAAKLGFAVDHVKKVPPTTSSRSHVLHPGDPRVVRLQRDDELLVPPRQL